MMPIFSHDVLGQNVQGLYMIFHLCDHIRIISINYNLKEMQLHTRIILMVTTNEHKQHKICSPEKNQTDSR